MPLFALLLYACGGGGNVGGEDRGIVLKLSEVSQGPYSRLTLRISGKDFEPLTYSKEGPLQPGQKVIFNVSVPQGSKKADRGNPLRQGWKARILCLRGLRTYPGCLCGFGAKAHGWECGCL